MFERVLKTSPEAFDTKFDDYMKQRFGAQLAVIEPREGRAGRGGGESTDAIDGELARTMADALAAVEAKNFDEAVPLLEEREDDVPGLRRYRCVLAAAQVHKARGNVRAAATSSPP